MVARLEQTAFVSEAHQPHGERMDAGAASGPQWVIETTAGLTVHGYLPAWADCDPSMSGLRLERLQFRLADICHRDVFEGLALRVQAPPLGGGSKRVEEQVFWGSIDCHPFAEDPEPRIPVVNIAVVEDFWINDLDPDGLAEVAAELRAQADRLDHEVRPRLIAARADWAERRAAWPPFPRGLDRGAERGEAQAPSGPGSP